MRSRLLILPLLVALAACAAPSPASRPPRELPPGRPQPAHPASPAILPTVDRIAVVVMENREYGQVIGNASAPYTNRLANRFTLATHFFAVSHPSLPNYLALIGGSTFGISSDCTTCHVSGWSLVDQLEAHGISWRAYMQGMPSPCYKGAFSGRYAKKHDPFMYFDRIRTKASRCSNVVPYTRLASDISKGKLPSFVWITPDECHDGHDCSTRTADRFLHQQLPPLLMALGKNGLLFLTWDEGATSAGCCTIAHGGHVVTILAGPKAKLGVRSKTAFDFYSILRTIEDLWSLPHMRHAGCACTRSMTGLVR
jgi:phosphatidylinositol-3-phosphatase